MTLPKNMLPIVGAILVLLLLVGGGLTLAFCGGDSSDLGHIDYP